MIELIPSWAHHNEEFWETINKRNAWFIKLRYGAAAMLLALLLFAVFIGGLKLSAAQQFWISFVTVSIVAYNIIISRLTKYLLNSPLNFNPVHISVLQMVLDLTALSLLVYYTGGVETPLALLFFFHMVIGSLILPGLIMYTIAGVLIFFYVSMSFLELYAVLPHHAVQGFLQNPFYDNLAYVTAFDIIFSFVLVMLVVLTNGMAKQLYKMQEHLLDSIDKIKNTEIEKEQYIIGVVHEIKTPVAAVESYLDVILSNILGPLHPKVEEKLKRMRSRATEAIELINNILKISRIKLMDDILKEEINIKRVLSTVYSKQKDRIRTKQICFSFDDSRKNKRNIVGDLFLLEVAFSNILSNAVKYASSEGNIKMLLTDDDEKMYVVIMDDGIGIPKEDQQNIFNQFYRASNTRNKPYEGVGLGLAVVKQIIERHGGKISLESPSPIGSPDKPGTSIIIALPLI